jgi:SNF2 family DNA or RNA helicase
VSTLIADESTTIKTPKAKVTKAALHCAAVVRDIPKLILTGNPIPESPLEIWSQISFTKNLTPKERNGEYSYYQFLKYWCVKSNYGYHLKLDRQYDFLHNLHACGVWSAITDRSQLQASQALPSSHYVMEYYDLLPEQTTLIAHLYKDWSIQNQDGTEMELDYSIALAQKAQQICSGFYYDERNQVVPAISTNLNPKLQVLVDIIQTLLEENQQRKIVIWRKYRYEDDLLCSTLQHAEQRVIVGPSAGALQAFLARPDIRIIIMPVDCSQGFNELVVADTNIFFSNDFSQEKRLQAEARIDRLGQLSPDVTHIDIVSTTGRDQDIATALQGKNLTKERLATIVKMSYLQGD